MTRDLKKFAAFDIDGTLIRWQLYHATADKLASLGYIDKSAFDAIKDSRMAWKTREHSESFKVYEVELVGLYYRSIANLAVEQFQEAVKAVFEEYKDQVYTYTRDLIKSLKQSGYLLFAISGSQSDIVAMISEYYGFDDYSGTEYLQKDGRYTGKAVFRAENKDEVLNEMIKKHNVTKSGSIAVGDSAGDIKMLELVEGPIAFNPEAKLFKHAKDKGWKIVVERKNMVYELEQRDGKYELVKTTD